MDLVKIELDPFRTSDGVLLFRRAFRPATAPIGDLLICHGIGESSSRYIQAARAFAEAGWRTVIFDLRGHGRSEGPRGYVPTWRRFHDDLAEQVDALSNSDRPLVVLGHSMGGLIAFGAAASGKIRPAKLVLSAPALEANIATWKRVLAPILSRILPELRIPTGVGADVDLGQRLPSEDPDAPEYLYAVTTRLGDEAFRAQRSARAVVAKGGAFPVETLVVHGTGDKLVRPEWCRPIAGLGGVHYESLDGFNHHPFATLRYMDAVNRILEFIGRA
jgi:alpha-beta hydrolase superfamily lysophospholipase